MTSDPTPLLWLCGPPGVGKTAVGWELFTLVTRAGIDAGYVDIDQLGMCYPESAADPGRHWLKARNLGAVVANYRRSGARRIVVSGVVDPVRGVYAELIPDAALTVCRLSAVRDELMERLAGRDGQVNVREVVAEADALDESNVADACVDTSGLTVAEVTRLVRQSTGGWPVRTAARRAAVAPRGTGAAGRGAADAVRGTAAESADPGDGAATVCGAVLVVCGQRGVGKSTVGFTVYQRILTAGIPAAYVDLDQIGFCRPAPAGDRGNHKVKADNLAAIWRAYREAGAQHLIAAGPIDDENAAAIYADALPSATFTYCRLHAGRDQLVHRMMLRAAGRGSWPQPGDPLIGLSAGRLGQLADHAAADAEALDHSAFADLRIDTNACTAHEAADAIITQTGWLTSASGKGHRWR